jgi:hypothetical protein
MNDYPLISNLFGSCSILLRLAEGGDRGAWQPNAAYFGHLPLASN